MAHLNPAEAFDHFKKRVLEGIESHFPEGKVQGKVQSLHLDGLEVKDDLHPDDLRGQHKAKVEGDSWSVPVFAHLTLKDNETGKVIDSRKVRVAEIPKTTSRYSYIVGGPTGSQEYQVDNQWQLKPGVYTRRRNNGQLESRVNVSGRASFDVVFNPEKKIFDMQYGSSKASIPLYPIMKQMGVSDDDLQKSWGKEIFEANKNARGAAGALEKFYKASRKSVAPSKEIAAQYVTDTLMASSLRPDSTKITLGKEFDHVDGDVLHRTTEKLLKVQAGHPEDDRDSLIFKDLRTVGDFAHDFLRDARKNVSSRMQRQVNRATGVRDVVKFDLFNEPIKQTFHKNMAARVASQINPVEMVSSSMQTTIMGPGGIQSEKSVNDEAKFVNPSHLGFLDPINTPEGEKTGVTLRLPIGVKKVGNEPRIHLYNTKTGKTDLVSPGEFVQSRVVLPDQVRWENGKPVPLHSTVKMSGQDNQIVDGKFDDAHYVMRHSSQLFNMTSNLIPFLGNTNGGRASMASRHIEQSISLLHREAPLVQVDSGVATKGIDSFEGLLGKQSSHSSPIAGKVVEIKKDGIVIQGEGGRQEVQIYNNYPVNDTKSVLHSTSLVKVGDTVKAGQTIADTNYSKNGTLALGTNLRVAYIPFKGYNFEDGIVISRSAANKLSSEHLHKDHLQLDRDLSVNKKKFQVQHPGLFSRAQFDKIDDSGLVRVGQKVAPGDPLILATKPYLLKDRTGLAAIRKSMTGTHSDKSMRWDSDFEGEVVDVHHGNDKITVHVRTVEPMQVGDKMAGRYGNKGIVTQILDDHEMPHTKDGKHIEVALNPSGVPGRMNVGQVLETAVSKVALKTGKPYLVKNFEAETDHLQKVKDLLKEHGIPDTEEVIDPHTKQSLGKTMIGQQYMMKLVHQVDKKLSVRSGMPGIRNNEHYDLNLQPSSGGGTGGQSMGVLGMYAMLAHGAKANIREMQTWKSEGPDPQTNPDKRWASQHNQVWAAIQTGAPLPTPTPTFAFRKFEDMLRASGVNMDKKGHNFILSPMTDSQVKEMAPNVLTKPADLLYAKNTKDGDLRPRPGGLFDEKLTGGHQGRKWSRIELAEPLPNPVFEPAILSLLGMKAKDFASVIHGEKSVDSFGQTGPVGQGPTGGSAIKGLLDKIDVEKALPLAKKVLQDAKGPKVDAALKKVKYLQALNQLKLKPSEAYILHNLPVLPPVMRPVSQLPSGDLKYADVNGLYSEFAKINEKLKDPTLTRHLTDESKGDLRREYYDGVKALMGVGIPYDDVKQKGLFHQIAGGIPKNGFFQETLMNRRQDLTMRSTIIPEPALGLDEVGIPRAAALDLFKPFVVKKLWEMGVIKTPMGGEATAIFDKKPKVVWDALEKVMDERPVLMKRDPALHKYSVQAFNAKLSPGSAVQIHPLVTGGYNADFDGDTMSIFVPISHEAVEEARKMYPSNNLLAESTGKVVYQPTLESALGLYKLSRVNAAKDKTPTFANPGLALDHVRDGKLHINDRVHIPGGETTAGRILLAATLPGDKKDGTPLQKNILHDLKSTVDRGGLDRLLTTLAKEHMSDYGVVVNKLKDMGNGAAFGTVTLPHLNAGHAFHFESIKGYNAAGVNPKLSISIPVGTHTLGLNDFTPDHATRDPILKATQKKVDALRADKNLATHEQDRQAVLLWNQASSDMKKAHIINASKDPSNLFLMHEAGVKPGWDQYKQMVLAPMLFQDSSNKTLPTPVTKSYAEGLDVSGYWNQMPGARRGAVMKVQEVQEPGYMSKLLMNNMMHLLVNNHDCGTAHGIALSVDEKDVHDRHLAQDFKQGDLHFKAGDLVTPDMMSKIRRGNQNAKIIVRSPLKCEEEKGLCQKCVGLAANGQLHPLGTNIGVISAHTVGERAVQLTLKSFHTGGVVEAGGAKNLLNSFARFQQLAKLEEPSNAATLAMQGGKIEKIVPHGTGTDVYIGGEKHFVGKDTKGLSLLHDLPHASLDPTYTPWKPPSVGMHVEPGQFLSDPNRTILSPHDLYRATKSIDRVQNHLATELYGLYKDENIKRRAVEVMVKSMSNLTKVSDPGDHPNVLRGEFRPTSVIRKLNAELVQQGKKPIEHEPVLKGVEYMPLELQEDWMAKMQHRELRGTLLDASANLGISAVHGMHPVPGIAFGAEFGLTSADAKKPGLHHLHDVAKHHY